MGRAPVLPDADSFRDVPPIVPGAAGLVGCRAPRPLYVVCISRAFGMCLYTTDMLPTLVKFHPLAILQVGEFRFTSYVFSGALRMLPLLWDIR